VNTPAKLLNRNCYRLSRVLWALSQISFCSCSCSCISCCCSLAGDFLSAAADEDYDLFTDAVTICRSHRSTTSTAITATTAAAAAAAIDDDVNDGPMIELEQDCNDDEPVQ